MKYLVKLSFYSIILGALATAMLDIWNWSRHYLFDTPLTKYEFIGRWMLYMLDGQFYHTSIKASSALPYELLAGWLGHYFIGIVFAAFFLSVIHIGGDYALVTAKLPISSVHIFQGLLLVTYLASYTLVNYRFKPRKARIKEIESYLT